MSLNLKLPILFFWLKFLLPIVVSILLNLFLSYQFLVLLLLRSVAYFKSSINSFFDSLFIFSIDLLSDSLIDSLMDSLPDSSINALVDFLVDTLLISSIVSLSCINLIFGVNSLLHFKVDLLPCLLKILSHLFSVSTSKSLKLIQKYWLLLSITVSKSHL